MELGTVEVNIEKKLRSILDRPYSYNPILPEGNTCHECPSQSRQLSPNLSSNDPSQGQSMELEQLLIALFPRLLILKSHDFVRLFLTASHNVNTPAPSQQYERPIRVNITPSPSRSPLTLQYNTPNSPTDKSSTCQAKPWKMGRAKLGLGTRRDISRLSLETFCENISLAAKIFSGCEDLFMDCDNQFSSLR
ncbi:hypothetical protein BGX38DRAFT_824261 [Terfezia claveryi]|nr:hypothetical protein BGX38DRAFT_824261 [Terfezia claveryi]